MTQQPMESVPTEIFDTTRCELGEGCGYDLATDTVWWFDILRCRMFEVNWSTRHVQVHVLPRMASAAAFIDDHRQLLATDEGIYLRERASGRLTLLTPLEADNPSTRSNDGRTHSCGAFWIGTMGRKAESGAGAIYHFHGGTLRRLYGGMTVPNAICFSPDGATAYFTDTRQKILNRVAIDPVTALPRGEPQMLYDHRGGAGGMDGAVVDAEGLIWNARWGGSCIDVYSPQGHRVRTIAVPATRPSCPAFVGARLDRLLVTTAAQGLDEAAKRDDPGPGLTYLLEAGARGRAEARASLAGWSGEA